jgi:hypothetical protein
MIAEYITHQDKLNLATKALRPGMMSNGLQPERDFSRFSKPPALAGGRSSGLRREILAYPAIHLPRP